MSGGVFFHEQFQQLTTGWVEGSLGLVEGAVVVALEGLPELGSSCPGNTSALPSLPPEMPRLFLIILLCWRT